MTKTVCHSPATRLAGERKVKLLNSLGGDRVRTTHLRPITALRNSLMWMVLITVTPEAMPDSVNVGATPPALT